MTEALRKNEESTGQNIGARVNPANQLTLTPPVDIYETKESFVMLADLPGADEKTLDVSLEKNVLTLSARTQNVARDGYRLGYQELRSGDYYRAFTVGDQIDRDGIKATMKNGQLKLVLPKAREAQPRKITVSVS